ncbi:MAG: hypothetical protein GXP63_05625, partial [DPANN group archaeon]|nr:hypothetical protein [DPANN group archaeon]
SFTTRYIDDVQASISVYDEEGTLLKTLKTNHAGLKSYERLPLVTLFNAAGLKKGKYSTKATVTYDGKTMELESGFRVGTLNILINDIPTQMTRNSISPFSIAVESEWNLPLKGVWAELRVGKETAKTPTLDLAAMQKTRLKGFIQLGDMPDTANISVVVFYEGEEGTLTFSKQGIVRLTDPTTEEKQNPARERPAESSMLRIGIIMGGILLLVLLAFNMFWMYRSIRARI